MTRGEGAHARPRPASLFSLYDCLTAPLVSVT